MDQDTQEHLDRISQAFESRMYSKARWHASELIRSAPQKAEYLVLRADAHAMDGNLSASRRDYKKAAAIDPQSLHTSRRLTPEQIGNLTARYGPGSSTTTNRPRSAKKANRSRFGAAVAVLALLAVLVVVYLSSLNQQGTSSQPTTSTPSSQSTTSAPFTSSNFDRANITAADWAMMTESQKTRWVNIALDAMEQGGALLPSERKSASYYVSALNNVLARSTSQESLVAWELTAFTADADIDFSVPPGTEYEEAARHLLARKDALDNQMNGPNVEAGRLMDKFEYSAADKVMYEAFSRYAEGVQRLIREWDSLAPPNKYAAAHAAYSNALRIDLSLAESYRDCFAREDASCVTATARRAMETWPERKQALDLLESAGL